MATVYLKSTASTTVLRVWVVQVEQKVPQTVSTTERYRWRDVGAVTQNAELNFGFRKNVQGQQVAHGYPSFDEIVACPNPPSLGRRRLYGFTVKLQPVADLKDLYAATYLPGRSCCCSLPVQTPKSCCVKSSIIRTYPHLQSRSLSQCAKSSGWQPWNGHRGASSGKTGGSSDSQQSHPQFAQRQHPGPEPQPGHGTPYFRT